MAELNNLFTKIALIGLMIFCLLAFAIQTQSKNNVSNGLIENELINSSYSNLDSNLDSIRDTSQAQLIAFQKENPTTTFGTLLIVSIVSVGKVFTSMIIGIFNLIINIPAVVLGVDSAIIGVLSGILIITLITAAWILYKMGS